MYASLNNIHSSDLIESEGKLAINIVYKRIKFTEQIKNQQTDKQNQADANNRKHCGDKRLAKRVIMCHHHAKEEQSNDPRNYNDVQIGVKRHFFVNQHMAQDKLER